jgi:hypothetical protein
MSARLKLNRAYFVGSLWLAGVVGGLTQSWLIFVLGLLALLAANLYAGEIRPTRRRP